MGNRFVHGTKGSEVGKAHTAFLRRSQLSTMKPDELLVLQQSRRQQSAQD